MTDKERALAPGRIVHSRYRIEKVLGAGGFGITYQATDLKKNQLVAMKEYFPVEIAVREAGSDDVIPKLERAKSFHQFKDKFLDEAQLIHRYGGNNCIVDVIHLFRSNNTAYYTMEYIPGGDLRELLKQNGGSIEWEYLRPIIEQTVSALSVVHKDKIVHCDISPDNIFVRDDGQVKLIDFGAAKSTIKSSGSTVLLKRGYAPPEQLSQEGNLGPWTDIYALAVTIYRCCTGRLPPPAEERIQADRTIWPSELQVQIPSQRWEQTLKKAMAIRVDDRYQNVDEFWRDLTVDSRPSGTLALEGTQGYYKGKVIPVDGDLIFGRDPNVCRILYPANTPGVSGKQLCVWMEQGKLLIMDMGSTYGTWLGDKKLRPGLCYVMQPTDVVFFGASQMFRVITMAENEGYIGSTYKWHGGL